MVEAAPARKLRKDEPINMISVNRPEPAGTDITIYS